MKYISPKEAAQKWGISQRRVNTLCNEGRIEEMVRHSRVWLIPETAEKPADARIKSGRYMKKNPRDMTAEAEIVATTSIMAQPKAENRPFPIPALSGAVIPRPRLVERIALAGSSLTYIHADAGYGKTTLLAQYAAGRKNVVWLTLDERDGDLTNLLRHLEDAFCRKLPGLNFHATDLIPFAANDDFVSAALASLFKAVGRRKLILILDDVHVVTDGPALDFLIGLAKSRPPGLNLIMAGRHEPWSGLFRLKMDGKITELNKTDLRFTREEALQLLGFFDESVYTATEGWALALQSYRMAAEGGKLRLPHDDRNLKHYLMNEIFNRLSEETRHFLLATAWLPRLDPSVCNRLLGIANAQEILEGLVRGNVFTVQENGLYHYHPLFAVFLRQSDSTLGRKTLRRAMADCFARGEYEQAADYALLAEDAAFIHECISAALGRPFGRGRYGDLQGYFQCMDDQKIALSPRVLLARGMYLSSRGQFIEADRLIRAALPELESRDPTVWCYAMTHKARILRNRASIGESNKLLESLLPLPEKAPPEDWYLVVIEKIHNLVLSGCLYKAYELLLSMLEKCTALGSPRVRAWFERYLTVIYFYQGDYLKCLHFYEKSLTLPEEEQDWLARHCVGAYAAKAYQITGQEEKAVPLMEAELARLRRLGLHEELSLNYLMFSEILLAEETRKNIGGSSADFSEFHRYLELAEEHIALKRNAGDYRLFAKILHLGAELIFRPEKALARVEEILQLAEQATPFFQSLAYGRAANALNLLGQDTEQAKACYRQCIERGEAAGTMGTPTQAYGELAALYLKEKEEGQTEECTRRFLELARQYGHRFCFRLKPLFGEVLEFALSRSIAPEFVREMLSYGGYAAKKVYINTLGAFYIASVHDRRRSVKIRTQKARELLAYLLEHREGVSRERIFADLWTDSEADVTSLFHTRRGEIRRSFESLGAQNPILREKDRYRLAIEEIICDYDAFRQAAEEFHKDPTPENAQRVVDHYTGRYLDDLEALWAESTRLRCEDTFLQAAEALLESYRESGERAKTVELLRRLTGVGYRGQRYDTVKDEQKRKLK